MTPTPGQPKPRGEHRPELTEVHMPTGAMPAWICRDCEPPVTSHGFVSVERAEWDARNHRHVDEPPNGSVPVN